MDGSRFVKREQPASIAPAGGGPIAKVQDNWTFMLGPLPAGKAWNIPQTYPGGLQAWNRPQRGSLAPERR